MLPPSLIKSGIASVHAVIPTAEAAQVNRIPRVVLYSLCALSYLYLYLYLSRSPWVESFGEREALRRKSRVDLIGPIGFRLCARTIISRNHWERSSIGLACAVLCCAVLCYFGRSQSASTTSFSSLSRLPWDPPDLVALRRSVAYIFTHL
ncbi:hypothetical protein GGS23DRAFT_53934 [Durotheca rogersii]|uniref:uncharacterized protein n=1 Tax=Durotheca rogersii TaxID=419775 RepID=UPI00221F131F|nr:uncharacterized protein GGS23DRAFT_53934 [Durotheca rogersii]KAI5863119.1 hypothetical protein GGS23DRAFT_53934 [Durotheca rogersii]